MFTLFNNANYGTHVTQESNAAYGKPAFNSNIAYQPLTLQLGFLTRHCQVDEGSPWFPLEVEILEEYSTCLRCPSR